MSLHPEHNIMRKKLMQIMTTEKGQGERCRCDPVCAVLPSSEGEKVGSP